MSATRDTLLAYRDMTKILQGISDALQEFAEAHDEAAFALIDYLWYMIELYTRLDPPPRPTGEVDAFTLRVDSLSGNIFLFEDEGAARATEANAIKTRARGPKISPPSPDAPAEADRWNFLKTLDIETLESYAILPPRLFALGMKAVAKANSPETKKVANRTYNSILKAQAFGILPRLMKQNLLALLSNFLALYIDASGRESDGIDRVLLTLNQISFAFAKSADIPMMPRFEEGGAEGPSPPQPKKTAARAKSTGSEL